MTQDLEQFGRYLICQGPDRTPVTFAGVPDEMLCLAFDSETQGLVELHILPASEDFTAETLQSFTERAWMASSLHSPCCCKILDVGNCGGLAYYTTEISDGESITSFVKRNGPLETPLTLALVIQLTDAIFQMQSKARLLQGLNLGRMQVVLARDSHLALHMVDCGLACGESEHPVNIRPRRMISEVSQILLFLLSAKPYQPKGGDEQFDKLDSLPTNVKYILKHTLNPASANGPTSLAEFRNELRDAYGAVSSRITKGSRFQPPPVPKRLLPAFRLKQKLFPDLDVGKEVADQYTTKEAAEDDYHIYQACGEFQHDGAAEESVIQILPHPHTWPAFERKNLELNLAKIDPATHSYLLPVREVRESKQAVLIAEQPTVGFSLADILSMRHHKLEPIESIILLNHIRHAINQARENRIPILGLSIHSVQIHFTQQTRFRTRKLQKRRIDHWPEFQLKLRCHPTTEGLISAPPAGRIESGLNREKPPSADGMLYKNYIAIAEQLVLGTHFEYGSIPDESLFLALNTLRKFLQENYKAVNDCVVTFDLHHFLEQLAELLDSLNLSSSEEVGMIVDGATEISLPEKKNLAPFGGSPDELPAQTPDSGNSAFLNANHEIGETAMVSGTVDDDEFHEPTLQGSTGESPKKRAWFKRPGS